MAGMNYELLRDLEKVGAEREKLQARLEDVRARLHERVLAAWAAGYKQVDIVKASRYTRDAVRLIIKKAGERSAPTPDGSP